ncbi:MAG: hypothetical protein V4568_04450 [Pseudomonadota bacterium]
MLVDKFIQHLAAIINQTDLGFMRQTNIAELTQTLANESRVSSINAPEECL